MGASSSLPSSVPSEGSTRLVGRLSTAPAGLFAYHVLILAGAAILLLGVVRAAWPFEIVGGALVVVGTGLQMSIIVGSARLARDAGVAHDAIGPLESSAGHRRCIACGWNGATSSIFCARCHRVTIPDMYVPARR